MRGVDLRRVGAIALSASAFAFSSCKQEEKQPDAPAAVREIKALQLPGVDRVPEQEELHKNGTLSGLIGVGMVSKIGQMNDRFAFGVAINGNDYKIISSSADIGVYTKEILIFNDLKDLIGEFNSSIHGESYNYAETTRRICQARADDFMTSRQINAAADYMDTSVSINNHTVRSGENLSAIAYGIIRKSGQTFDRYEAEANTISLTKIITKLNELPEDATLSKGQILRVPVAKKGVDLKGVVGTLEKGPMLEKIALLTYPAQ